MANLVAVWGPAVSTVALLWGFWRQSRPVVRLRAKAEMRIAGEPYDDEVTITVTNLGMVPVTLADLALVVYPNLLFRLTRVAPHWHNLAGKCNPGVQLPKLLVAGEEWKGEAALDSELLEELDRGRLYFKLYVSHQRSRIGRVRRETIFQLLRK